MKLYNFISVILFGLSVPIGIWSHALAAEPSLVTPIRTDVDTSVETTLDDIDKLLISKPPRNVESEPSQPLFKGTLKPGLFIDSYYAFDFGQPRLFNRGFTTQAVRHNEYNINLAKLSLNHSAELFRTILSLQAGTSVQAAYSSEYKNGAISGGDLSRIIGDAQIGLKSGEDSWFDVGLMPSLANLESFISTENWTYTRTIFGEQLPSYQVGMQFSTKLSDAWRLRFAIINGWQIVSESNNDKSLVMRINYDISPKFKWEFSTFNGKEAHPSLKAHTFRNFNELMLTIAMTEDFKIRPLLAAGFQNRTFIKGADYMWGGGFLTQYRSTPVTTYTSRIEFFSDRAQTLVKTTSANGYFSWAIGMGVDHFFTDQVLGRLEYRGYGSQDEIFQASTGMARLTSAVIASLALNLN